MKESCGKGPASRPGPEQCGGDREVMAEALAGAPESRSSSIETNDEVILQVRNLKTHFHLRSGVTRAVDGVDLAVKRRRTLGLVGESGSGKSVASLSIMRLIKSPPGRIVDGEVFFHAAGRKPVELLSLKSNGREIRRIRGGQISMIFQEPMTSLNPLYTVGRQIAESVRLHQNVGRSEAMGRAREMLEKVQIGDAGRRLKEYPHQLSGGMRQRVMIATALSCNPAVLIADEPTTALDVTVQAQILQLLAALQEDLGTGVILITHNLGVIAETADEVAVMYLGKVVEHAEVKALFRGPKHPYTVGLLNSVPVFGRKRKTLQAIGGGSEEGPPAAGCAFAPRCGRCKPICRKKPPPTEGNRRRPRRGVLAVLTRDDDAGLCTIATLEAPHGRAGRGRCDSLGLRRRDAPPGGRGPSPSSRPDRGGPAGGARILSAGRRGPRPKAQDLRAGGDRPVQGPAVL